MTYTLAANPDVVLRDADGAWIPNHPGNRDWQDYQAWLADGNTPNPYVPPPLTRQQVADNYLAGGLTVNQITYPINEPYNHYINSLMTGLNIDGSFPNNQPAVGIVDIDNTMRIFDKKTYPKFAKAVRDFHHACNLYAQGISNTLPANAVAI